MVVYWNYIFVLILAGCVNSMELRKDKDNTSSVIHIHEEDSTIYLFGSELYCGWCLESFTCPVRLKIHCHIEHLSSCSCGEQYCDKQSLLRHIANAGCLLPPPFQWSHFVTLPLGKPNEVNSTGTEASEDENSLDERQVTEEKTLNKSVKDLGKSVQKMEAKSPSDKVKDSIREQSSVFASANCARSCPKCLRSFSGTSMYLRHRSLCQAIQRRKGVRRHVDANRYHYLFKFCEQVSDGRWKCKLCKIPSITRYRSDLYKHIRAKHGEVQNTSKDAIKESSLEVNAIKNGKTLSVKRRQDANKESGKDASKESSLKINAVKNQKSLKCKQDGNKEPSLQTSKEIQFCCGLCPYQSTHRSNCYRHIRQKHGNGVEKSEPWNSCHEKLEKSEGDITVDNEAAVGTPCKASDTPEAAVQETLAGKSDCVNSSLASSESCCEKHRSDDVSFIVSCFSSSVGGKPLCCNFCSGQFGEWEEAAVHVYSTHSTALQQWRDTRANVIIEPLAGSAASGQIEKSPSAVKCDVSESDDGVCGGKVQPNASEHSSVNSDCNTSNVCAPENEIKHEFTVDDYKVLVSSLCRLFNCQNGEPKTELPDSKMLPPHNAKLEDCVTTPSPTKKLPTASHTNPTYMTSDMRLISRKCKFCHRVCSTQYNCQKHEAVCPRMLLLSSKSSVQKSSIQRKAVVRHQSSGHTGVRKIHGSNMFYCAQCGYSDSDQHVVSKHLMEPHVYINGRLRAKVYPEHDYIGGMKVTNGNFKCGLCGSHMHSRPKLLVHLQSHSSPVGQMAIMHTTCPESASDKAKDGVKEHSGLISSAKCTRSCPKCSRSFPDVSTYLRHRAVCRAVQHPKGIQRHYLFNFCEQASDGQWRCKLCKHSMRKRVNVYRHIRCKHGEVQNTKLDASKQSGLKIAGDTCKLCKRRCTKHAVKNTAMHGVQQKSHLKHYVKPCPTCNRVFTFRSGYVNHVKWCGKLELDRFVEHMASGSVRCGICRVTYSGRSPCVKHLRRKHDLSGELRNVLHIHAGTHVKTENSVPADDSVTASDADEKCSFDIETAVKAKN